MKIAVLGGDGFVGWPTCLPLAAAGQEVPVTGNLSRPRVDTEIGG